MWTKSAMMTAIVLLMAVCCFHMAVGHNMMITDKEYGDTEAEKKFYNPEKVAGWRSLLLRAQMAIMNQKNIKLNRPAQRNALNDQIWREIGDVFDWISTDPDCRAVLLSGAGKCFCSGLDLKGAMSIFAGGLDDGDVDIARQGRYMRDKVKKYQQYFTAIEQCPKPVIVAIHGACLGAAVDLITACDIRYASTDAHFCIKEVDIGITADVGTLNRLPKIVGNDSLVRELCLTARPFDASDALNYGLLSAVYTTQEALFKSALALAANIAKKSPIAVQGTKVTLNYARDHTVQDSLEFVANWNMSQLFSEDAKKSALVAMTKGPLPTFSKL